MQVAWPKEGDINTRHAEDGVEVMQGLGALDLDDDQDLIVGLLIIAIPVGGTKAVGGEGAANAAGANWRIFAPAHDLLRFLTCIDHRHHDSPGARVERPFEPVYAGLWNTDDRRTGTCVSY